jgi:hypothetical protein
MNRDLLRGFIANTLELLRQLLQRTYQMRDINSNVF